MSEVPTTEPVSPTVPRILGVHRAHFLYAVALLGSAALLFEESDFIIGPVVLVLWAVVFYSRSRPIRLCIVCVLAFLHFCLYPMFAPRALEAHVNERRSDRKNNLKQIMLALHNYHEDYGSFPPAYVADENGRPMHS